MPFDAETIPVVHAPAPVTPDGLNRENIARVRDFIAELPAKHFDMGFYEAERSCGTVACIAGWACVIFDSRKDIDAPSYNYFRRAREIFGLHTADADRLFLDGARSGRVLEAVWEATPTQAAAVLTGILDHHETTGEVVVDWSLAEAVTA